MAFLMSNTKGLCIECHEEISLLEKRGNDTSVLFLVVDQPQQPFSICKQLNNGLYCARMRTIRQTKCAGCNL